MEADVRYLVRATSQAGEAVSGVGQRPLRSTNQTAAINVFCSLLYVLKRDSANDITITQMFITLAIMLEVY